MNVNLILILTKKGIELPRSCGDALNLLALLHDCHARLEAHSFNLGSCLIDLLSLLLSDTLDVEHVFLGAN
jgi:hypothetical protein